MEPAEYWLCVRQTTLTVNKLVLDLPYCLLHHVKSTRVQHVKTLMIYETNTYLQKKKTQIEIIRNIL